MDVPSSWQGVSWGQDGPSPGHPHPDCGSVWAQCGWPPQTQPGKSSTSQGQVAISQGGQSLCTFPGFFPKNNPRGLPWWRSGWESACRCRGHGFEPWSGKIPHAAEQLGPWATTTEPARLKPVLRNKRGRDSERSAHRDEEWPPLATTRESPRTETKTQHSQK